MITEYVLVMMHPILFPPYLLTVYFGEREDFTAYESRLGPEDISEVVRFDDLPERVRELVVAVTALDIPCGRRAIYIDGLGGRGCNPHTDPALDFVWVFLPDDVYRDPWFHNRLRATDLDEAPDYDINQLMRF